ncbi:methyl-accepting chemotaxis protein [Metabacillus bambusae]|uniref:Methyl-accepting chemotaxis protein n=1 Tax=Metabacillus bambusae TaxID=2795218 RepID=A0ABS3N707_9BACI|nr:methyl-accepting chemotaxis protein [Metabacillus bambusae]MBO1513935.1 methyl-accepting chemotaxis protein [Metabacillus bambusae]
MNIKPKTLRAKFLAQLSAVLILVALSSGIIQYFYLKDQISKNIENQANLLNQGLQQGIKDTEIASVAIEDQINRKIISSSKYIGNLLEGKNVDNITNDELVDIQNQLGLNGLTVMARVNDDIQGVKSTDPNEIGFSIKEINSEAHNILDQMLKDEEIKDNDYFSFIDDVIVLPIVQSGSHGDKPMFFKYAYYKPKNTDYIIAPYIEANEVYQYTKEVGPDSWIQKMISENSITVEMGVLNPRVFEDKSLETAYYPPLKRIEFGSFKTKGPKDENILIDMIKKQKETSYIDNVNGKQMYKTFIPISQDRVIYIALDYDLLSAPLVRHSWILIATGIMSLVVLFLLAVSFFNQIYTNIQKVKVQMERLATGDLTAKSSIKNGGELTILSESANQMVDTLYEMLDNTNNQAITTQRLSYYLEQDTKKSVDELFNLSIETTGKQRQVVEDILYFLDQVEKHLKELETPEDNEILQKVDDMRLFARERASTTTEMTITLSDLVKSLHGQSKELSDVSKNLLEHLAKFKF